jgi:hypothetical protein
LTENLKERLEQVSRGRPVTVTAVPDHLLKRDDGVSFDPETDAYFVELTGGGCFEGAYRFLERWIARHALELDGVFVPPPDDHLDLTKEALYWMLERHSDQLLADLEQAVARYSRYLEEEMYYVPKLGDVMIEARVAALLGLLNHFDTARQEIHSAVLSPHTVEVLRAAGVLPADDPE